MEGKGRNSVAGSEPYCAKAWEQQGMTSSGKCRQFAWLRDDM